MENARTTIKFLASQAKSIHRYKSLRSKILKCNANIYFNRQCLVKNLTPKYATIKVPTTSKAAQNTQSKITYIRIKDEIKFLYKKKDQLNSPNSNKVYEDIYIVVLDGLIYILKLT